MPTDDTIRIEVPRALVEAVRTLRASQSDNAKTRALFDAEASLADAIIFAPPPIAADAGDEAIPMLPPRCVLCGNRSPGDDPCRQSTYAAIDEMRTTIARVEALAANMAAALGDLSPTGPGRRHEALMAWAGRNGEVGNG